jgi:Flp pilus assembly protein TadG
MKLGTFRGRRREVRRPEEAIPAVRRNRQRGAQIAEAAVVLPVLFFILFEIVWLCLAFSSSSTLQRAAKEGAIAATRASCGACGNAFQGVPEVFNAVNTTLQAGHLDSNNLVANAPAFVCNASPAPSCRTQGNVQVCTGVPLTCGGAACQTPAQNCGGNPVLGVRVSFGYRFNSPLPLGSWQNITIPASAQAPSEN